MNLTTQSTLVLLESDTSRVAGQLDHLNQLAQSALSEMRVLITKLKPEPVAGGDWRLPCAGTLPVASCLRALQKIIPVS